MRMRSRSVAVPSAAHNNNNHHNLNINNNNSSHVSSAATTGASRSVLNIPGELKLHYSEVVSVAEKLSRLFSRTHTYHVHRRHKTLRQEVSLERGWRRRGVLEEGGGAGERGRDERRA